MIFFKSKQADKQAQYPLIMFDSNDASSQAAKNSPKESEKHKIALVVPLLLFAFTYSLGALLVQQWLIIIAFIIAIAYGMLILLYFIGTQKRDVKDNENSSKNNHTDYDDYIIDIVSTLNAYDVEYSEKDINDIKEKTP